MLSQASDSTARRVRHRREGTCLVLREGSSPLELEHLLVCRGELTPAVGHVNVITRLLQLEAEHYSANGGSSGAVAEIAVAFGLYPMVT